MKPLLGGTHLVTGGGGAIGAQICRSTAEWGAERVLVADIDGDAAARTAAGIAVAEPVQLDVADPPSVESLVRGLEADGQSLAGLVNAAGIFGRHAFPENDRDEWDRVLHVNLVGCYSLVVAAMGLLTPGGAVVNITSVEGLMVLSTSGTSQPPYAASKGALQILTKTLAADLAPNAIRVNAVAPGYVETPLNAAVLNDPSRRAYIESRIPLGPRLGDPTDIAEVVCFLLSRAAKYVTGQTVVADGGLGLGVIRYPDREVRQP